ncbi:MAG: orotate phosphoribosyltransferase [Candidatus Omnitrophica bacterium]|nr:orotate phosphoribosyltransferase [Candidatus Omnitrophota bacterium]
MKMIGIDKDRQELFKLIKSKAYSEGKFLLSSGKISDYYIDCRKITLSSKGVYLTALLILDIIKNKRIDAVGGPTIGADPIVGAVSVLSLIKYNRPIKAFLVRKTAKTHGMKRQIEGPQLKKGACVVVIDDVATTGGSLIETVSCLRKKGIKVNTVITLVDRNEGAREKLKKANCNFISIFNIKDFKDN